MLVGVISDTHGHLPKTREAVRMFQSLGIDRLLHCGDIGTPEVVRLLAAWPVDYVLGNCDEEPEPLAEAVASSGGTLHGAFADLTIEGVRVAVLHGDDLRRLRTATRSGDYALVCHGHTHVAALSHEGATQVLNPGAIYRANPAAVAVVEFPSVTITPVTL